MSEYNGHPSRALWNVSLWVGNDEGLYRLALDCIRRGRTRDRQVELFREAVGEDAKTPDGYPYTKRAVLHALRGLS